MAKKIPMRQCVGCGEMKNKKEMMRVLKTPEEDEELKQLQAEIRVNLDADYFQWKEEQEKGEERADSGKTKEKTDGIQKVWKNLIGGHQHDDSGM